MTVGVTGVPFGGSSLAACVLGPMGVSMGGHAFRELDAELVLHLGGAWDQPPALHPEWERDARLDGFRSRAAGLLEDVFGSTRPSRGVVGWEDPQLALLLPFWQTVTSIDTSIVFVRDPDEVAAALGDRYAIDAPQAVLLWLRYLLSATADNPGHLLIRYDELVTDPIATLTAMARHLDLPVRESVLEASVREHLDPTPRREMATSATQAGDGNPIVALTRAVWDQGAIDLTAIPPIVAEGIRRGSLRPPVDGELLARARAEVMRLRERVRRQHRDRGAHEYTSIDGR